MQTTTQDILGKQHRGRANTIDGMRGKDGTKVLSSCLGMMFMTRGNQVEGKLNTFLFLDAQRQTEAAGNTAGHL